MIPVREQVRADYEFPLQRDVLQAGLLEQSAQPPVVIAGDPAHGYRGETGDEGFEFAPQSGNRDRAMDDIAQEHDLRRAIAGDQRGQAVDGIVRHGERHQLARMAVRPCIAEMEIRHYKSALFREPQRVPGIEVQIVRESVNAGDMGWGNKVDAEILLAAAEVSTGLLDSRPDFRPPQMK